MTTKPEPNTRAGEALAADNFKRTGEWPDPTSEMLETILFDVIWRTIKTWDVNVPHAYSGYMGATGNHVRAIYDAVAPLLTRPLPQPSELVERPSEAIEVLGGPYRQLDMDGVIVGVSRQAIYETLTYLTQLEAQIAKLQADGERLAEALEMIAAGHGCPSALATATLTEWKDRA